MTIFRQLPEPLSIEILCLWLDLYDVCKLDEAAAFCHATRSELSAIYSLKHFVLKIDLYQHETNTNHYQPLIEWICRSNIAIRNVKLDELCIASCCTKLNWNQVDTVFIDNRFHLSDEVYEKLVSAINTAPKVDTIVLRVLNCASWNNFFSNLSNSVIERLVDFSADEYFGLESFPSLQRVADLCTNLHHVSFQCSLPSLDEIDRVFVNQILHNNKGLRVIVLDKFGLTEQDIWDIAINCKLLEVFDMQQSLTISLKSVNTLFENCPNLISLDIGNETDMGNEYLLLKETKELELSCASAHPAEEMLRLLTSKNEVVQNLRTIWIDNLFACPNNVIDALVRSSKDTLFAVKSDYNDTSIVPTVYGLTQLLTHCKCITRLQIVGYTDITNDQLLDVFRISNIITSLTICYHDTIDAATVIGILTVCPALKELKCVSNLMMAPDSPDDRAILEYLEKSPRDVVFDNSISDEDQCECCLSVCFY